jgi:hypothetical protein
MRSKDYILKGNWREVDLCFNLHSNRWLKEFFDRTGLTLANTRRIMKDNHRRRAFILELDKQGVRVQDGRECVHLNDLKVTGQEIPSRDKELLEKFNETVKNAGRIKVNTFAANIALSNLGAGRVELNEFLERYEDKFKEEGIKIETDPKLEEYKTYSF